jgi:hypothetical protein
MNTYHLLIYIYNGRKTEGETHSYEAESLAQAMAMARNDFEGIVSITEVSR